MHAVLSASNDSYDCGNHHDGRGCRPCPAAALGTVRRAETDGRPRLEVSWPHARSAGDDGNDSMGLVRQCRIAAADHRFRRHRCYRVDVTFPWPALSGPYHRGTEKIAHRLAGPRADDADRSNLRQWGRARRHAADQDPEDRAAGMGREFQRSGNVWSISRQIPRWAGEVFLSRQ
jgi:hypothetical protein